MNEAVSILPDGRVFIDYGPVSMVITARNGDRMESEIAAESFGLIDATLADLRCYLSTIRHYPGDIDPSAFQGLPREMMSAVLSVGEKTLTPMATVAGGMSDLVADYIFSKGVPVVIVNNGGDIAIRLSPGEHIKMGIVSDIESGIVNETVVINADSGIGGVCTSGLGGRSLTRGIAQAVTVFSDRCIKADACATHIANCSYIESPAVKTVLAGEIEPGSDIADLTVVTEVGELSKKEIQMALLQMESEMKKQATKGNLICAAGYVQGQSIKFGLNAG